MLYAFELASGRLGSYPGPLRLEGGRNEAGYHPTGMRYVGKSLLIPASSLEASPVRALAAYDLVDDAGGVRLIVTGLESALRAAPACTCDHDNTVCSMDCESPLHALAHAPSHELEVGDPVRCPQSVPAWHVCPECDLAGYPFEVTLPLWKLIDREAGSLSFGVPLLFGTEPAFAPRPTFFRTYYVRAERFGAHPEQVRLTALFRRQSGALTPVKNPYTLALLREALGLGEVAHG